jgi:hypothetical protein
MNPLLTDTERDSLVFYETPASIVCDEPAAVGAPQFAPSLRRPFLGSPLASPGHDPWSLAALTGGVHRHIISHGSNRKPLEQAQIAKISESEV